MIDSTVRSMIEEKTGISFCEYMALLPDEQRRALGLEQELGLSNADFDLLYGRDEGNIDESEYTGPFVFTWYSDGC